MSSTAINSILSEIRAFSARTGAATDVAPSNAIQIERSPSKTPGFAETMSRMMDGVSNAQNTSGAMQEAFERGDTRVDLARVMVSMQQSQVAFRAAVEVRNRLVQAYQDVMNMPV